MLTPISINEKICIVKLLLNFFDESKKEEVQKILKKDKKIVNFSVEDFNKYYLTKKNKCIRNNQDLALIILKMLNKGYLFRPLTWGSTSLDKTCFKTTKKFTNVQKQSDFWLTEILGFDFLVEKLPPLIVQITGKDSNNDVHCGTGLLCSKNIILTCAHVINDMKIDEEQEINGTTVNVIEQKSHPKIDVGYIKINKEIGSEELIPFADPGILDEILVVGYPKIPRSISSPLLFQKGEVNGFAEDLCRNNYMLYSTITKPGNSGGPIFSSQGYVIGIVSQDFHEQNSQTMVDRFFAGVPTESIFKAINEIEPNLKLTKENFSSS